MTDIPTGAKVPTDHKKSAAQIEAEGVTTVTVECNGVHLGFPTDVDDWPVESVLAFEEGKVAVALRGVVDPRQWADLMATRPLKRDLVRIFDQLAESLGMERAGN